MQTLVLNRARSLNMAALFEGMRFHLGELSRNRRSKLKKVITKHGGSISQTAAGATQLVECEKLDWNHPEYVATTFVQDSVVAGKKQNTRNYKVAALTTPKKSRGRQSYTVEDDASMLQFVKKFNWESMQPVPASAWKIAEREKITSHSSESMREHFRKCLQKKTPLEQREIIAKAFSMISKSQAKEGGRQDKSPTATRRRELDLEEKQPESPANQEASTPATPSTAAARATPAAPVSPPAPVTTAVLAAPATPESTTVASPETPATPSRAATPVTPATTSPTTSPSSPANYAKEADQNTSKKAQKRKRSGSVAGSSERAEQQSLPPPAMPAESNDDSHESNSIYFTSTWSEVLRDPSKRQRLQTFFDPPTQESDAVDDTPAPVSSPERATDATQQSPPASMEEPASKEETKHIIYRLQLETSHEMAAVIHALFYCSGDADVARSFLMGVSPSAMWSPKDDRLLSNLLEREDGCSLSAVEEALSRDDFASMLVPRSADAILSRLRFLR